MEDQGKVNAYLCRLCGQKTFTRNRDCGVTPFMIKCPLCSTGTAESQFYRVPQNSKCSHEWYRPSWAEFQAANADDLREAARVRADLPAECVTEANFNHVAQGGLLLRQIRASV